jgi:glycosyltransferase involved in cell wall biosynthesis
MAKIYPSLRCEVLRPLEVGKANNIYPEQLNFSWALESTARLYQELRPDDKVLLIEYFSPAILQLMFTSLGRSVHWFGIVHANCFTPADYLENNPVCFSIERCLEENLHLFVATDYMKSLMPYSTDDKVTVSGLPVRLAQLKTWHKVSKGERKNRVVFSHRWSEEKHVYKYLQLALAARKVPELSQLEFAVLTASTSVMEEVQKLGLSGYLCPTKDDYYRTLGESSVLFADSSLETYGYSVREAAILELDLLLNKHLVYLEQFYAMFHNGTIEDMIRLLKSRKDKSGMKDRRDLTSATVICRTIMEK